MAFEECMKLASLVRMRSLVHSSHAVERSGVYMQAVRRPGLFVVVVL